MPESLPELFRRFDKGSIPLRSFVEGVEKLGFERTSDFDRLVAGNCSFSLVEVVKALKKNKENIALGGTSDRQTFSVVDVALETISPRSSTVFEAIAALARGSIGCGDFRHYLQNRGVVVGSDLDRVLRLHASDNSQSFQDFAKALKRQGVEVASLTPQISRASTPSLQDERTSQGRPPHPTRGLKSLGNHGNFIAWH